MNFRKILSQFDYLLIVIVLIIFSVGLLTIASATDFMNLGITREVKMQVVAFSLGIAAIILLQFINYEIFGMFYKSIYVLGILLLLLVYVPGLGVVREGSRRWIDIGLINIQTSELAKLAYILFYAKFLEKIGGIKGIKEIFKSLLVLAPYLVLVLKQPDLGTSLVFVFVTFGMMLVSGLKYRYVVLGVGTLGIAMPFIYPRLENHQRVRIDAFLNPEDLSLPGNYQVLQSKITIGSGRMYGKGLFEGVYHRLNYLPVQESDFIFAVFVEETGFVGGLALISMYFFFLMRMIHLSRKTKDDFGSYAIIGITFMFAFQIIENIAMTMGKLPVTGITLPFFSYGATAVLTSMLAIGLVETIYLRRQKGTFTHF
ncbi:FtsW/RodA/SpoVE family cell cycle protein [Fusibacter tunisiensis]|uniref:Rod shape determining protein RodA n=1 Tax=Fusibacter tunisiensis TaxID=1008308 RepID=A0ABS2MMX5_9FIRM|nr:FtsW/RodA/SpoVE family cell cycle protein [Fusibacter tunisiensis]MBM7560754.1 rod shape determining protein RodA [Fusibacter tunisiensis]